MPTQLQEILDKVTPYVVHYGLNIVAALLIFIIGKWIAKIISQVIEKALSRAHMNKTLVSFFKNMAFFVMLLFVVIAALGKLGVETNSFVVLVGSAGLAVGLALQGSLANFAAGVMLIIFQPFQVGEMIEAGGATGVVDEIQIFNTVMYTADKKKIIIPNAKITGDKIVVHPKA